MNEHIIFYDSDCLLCSRVIRFLILIDKNNLFYFAPLNGETYKKIISPKNYAENSIVYFRKNEEILRSKAVIQILVDLNGFWRFAFLFNYIPLTVLDFFYRLIAENRHRFFRSKSCEIKAKNNSSKFLP